MKRCDVLYVGWKNLAWVSCLAKLAICPCSPFCARSPLRASTRSRRRPPCFAARVGRTHGTSLEFRSACSKLATLLLPTYSFPQSRRPDRRATRNLSDGAHSTKQHAHFSKSVVQQLEKCASPSQPAWRSSRCRPAGTIRWRLSPRRKNR